MIIARTIEESNKLIDEEVSHIVRLEEKPFVIDYDGERRLIAGNENQWLVELPERKSQKSLKTKMYGRLSFFDSIQEFLISHYNKCAMAFFCERKYAVKMKTVSIDHVILTNRTDTLDFAGIEFKGRGGVFKSNIEELNPSRAYLIVLERNTNTENGCQILFTHPLRTNEEFLNKK